MTADHPLEMNEVDQNRDVALKRVQSDAEQSFYSATEVRGWWLRNAMCL